MFQLSPQEIHLGAVAANKRDAIQQVADALVQAGAVSANYLEGMLQREQQTSTYLGNGIAIPHGTIDTRDQVLKTGIQVFQFPQGVVWGDKHEHGDEEQIAYVVIGIAACSDEHLSLLRQLAHVLSDEQIAEQLAHTSSVDVLCQSLAGESSITTWQCDRSLIMLDVATDNLMTLQALNAGRLQQIAAVNAQFISEVITHAPVHLGRGIWLSDTRQGNLANALAISRPAQPFTHHGEKVTLLLTVAMTGSSSSTPLSTPLKNLSQLLLTGQAESLLNGDADKILALLHDAPAVSAQALTAEFRVNNAHGLHTRPGSILVNVIKQFTSEITVTNLDGSGNVANGRSLMKVVALGVKQGHRLRLTATGPDAEIALQTIGEAISSGLGEGAV